MVVHFVSVIPDVDLLQQNRSVGGHVQDVQPPGSGGRTAGPDSTPGASPSQWLLPVLLSPPSGSGSWSPTTGRVLHPMVPLPTAVIAQTHGR